MEVVELPPSLRAEVVPLWEECGLTRPWNDAAADLQRALRGPDSAVLAATDGDRLVGTVMVGHDGHRGWLYYLAVREDSRRRGVGRLLVRASEQWTAARAIPKLQLMVRTGNESVLAFYGQLGYEAGDVVVLGRRLDG